MNIHIEIGIYNIYVLQYGGSLCERNEMQDKADAGILLRRYLLN